MTSAVKISTLILFSALLALGAEPQPIQILTGKVVSIHDGDSITVLDAHKVQHKIRLHGIDAPERRQAFGKKSKQALGEKLHEKQARIEWSMLDQYDRKIGVVFVGDRNINREMVAEGWAWHFVKYSSAKELTEAEERARVNRVGLWADAKPVAPWEFRRSLDIAETALEKPLEAGAVFVTDNGTKYHRAGCRHLTDSARAISVADAQRRFRPCMVCKPGP